MSMIDIRTPSVPKKERLEARVAPDVKARLQRAADLSGRTLTEFVLSSAQEAAEEIIERNNVITLSVRDSAAFAEALLNPPAPNDALRAAAARYRKDVISDA
jgi:uncharacterized protein (DUF1778 family)